MTNIPESMKIGCILFTKCSPETGDVSVQAEVSNGKIFTAIITFEMQKSLISFLLAPDTNNDNIDSDPDCRYQGVTKEFGEICFVKIEPKTGEVYVMMEEMGFLYTLEMRQKLIEFLGWNVLQKSE